MIKRHISTDIIDSYRQTYVERDVRDIAAIEHLPDFNRLLSLLSFRTGQIVNFSEVSRELGIPFATLRRYVDLRRDEVSALLLAHLLRKRG